MRLLIDSDVLLDFIGERESTAAAWVKLHAMELAGAAELWVSAEAFGEVRTALAEALSDHDARSALRSAMAFLSVCSIDGPDVRFALEHEGLPYQRGPHRILRPQAAGRLHRHPRRRGIRLPGRAPRGPRRAVQRA